jgi:RNA polymerase sigma-70 factor (ECF subfamily)
MPGVTTAAKTLQTAESDERLLERIARDRDREAFKLLFDRYQTKGYSLAMYILGNTHAAEEAFQEAMIKVWLRAATYSGSGSIEGWIMRIVARQSTRSFRGASSKKSQRLVTEDQVCEKPLPAVQLADTELILMLRKALVALSGPERELIALRFAAGMSQQEISKELDVPQQTVSYRIDTILKRLRSLLPNADLAATLPIAELLREAVLSGSSAPASTCASILNRVSSSRRSMRVKAKSKAPMAAVGSAAAAIAVCAAFIWTAKGSPPPTVPPPAATSAKPVVSMPAAPAIKPESIKPEPKKAAEVATSEDPDFSYTWTFEKGLPPELPITVLHPNGAGWNESQKALVASEPAAIVFPFVVGRKPVKFTLRLRMNPVGQETKLGFNVTVYDPDPKNERRMLGFADNWHAPTKHAETGTIVQQECYMYDDMVTEFYQGAPFRVAKLLEKYRGNQIFLYLERTTLLSIEARTITPDQLPAVCHDIDKLTGSLERIHVPEFLQNSK